jgi:site-specific recombinase XerD
VISDQNARTLTPQPLAGFHHIKAEYAANSLTSALARGTITEDDRKLIEQHVAWVSVTSNISVGRVNKLTFHLVKWRRFLNSYRENSIEDIYLGIKNLKEALINGRNYSQNTIRDDISTLKKFYLWMIKKGYTSIAKDEIKEIKVPGGNTMTKTAGQMLTDEEIYALISVCTRSIDRAIISVLFEAGLRIKELATLTWEQVSFEKNNAVINVNVKTGKPRHIPIFFARPYLAAWKADYPYTPEGSAFVFLGETKHEPMRYQSLTKRIKLLATRAGITKKVTAHVFRHSRISQLMRQKVREYSIREIGWGNQSTKMLATYAHLFNGDIDAELSELNGIKPEHTPEDPVLNPRQCPRCAVINAPTANYCASCGVPLTPEAKVTIDELTVEIEAHPMYKQIMEKVEQFLLTHPQGNLPCASIPITSPSYHDTAKFS